MASVECNYEPLCRVLWESVSQVMRFLGEGELEAFEMYWYATCYSG